MSKHKHITEPDKRGYQVRIVRQGKESSRYFSHKIWGSKAKSLIAAQSWRDQMLVALSRKEHKYLSKPPLSNKKTTGIRGVSRSVQFDKRRNTHYLVYSVYWSRNKYVKHKTFQVGRVGNCSADEELHTFRTALQFRKEYEWCIRWKVEFDPDRYRFWRKTRLYEYGYCKIQTIKNPDRAGSTNRKSNNSSALSMRLAASQ